MASMVRRWTWQAPPGWPHPPAGWTPGPDWRPDPKWPPPPPGWQWWQLETTSEPRWYLRARLIGRAGIILFSLGVIVSFPFIYGDPVSGTVKRDPSWFPLVGRICIAALVVGLSLLLAPIVDCRRRRRARR
jgi:hypothetical protein